MSKSRPAFDEADEPGVTYPPLRDNTPSGREDGNRSGSPLPPRAGDPSAGGISDERSTASQWDGRVDHFSASAVSSATVSATWSTPGGGQVLVTAVGRIEYLDAWPDQVDRGEVVSFLRFGP